MPKPHRKNKLWISWSACFVISLLKKLFNVVHTTLCYTNRISGPLFSDKIDFFCWTIKYFILQSPVDSLLVLLKMLLKIELLLRFYWYSKERWYVKGYSCYIKKPLISRREKIGWKHIPIWHTMFSLKHFLIFIK